MSSRWRSLEPHTDGFGPARWFIGIQFDEFELDVRAGDLRRNGERIPLQPKVAELLSALLERPGELVTRDEVRAKLWGSETFVDFDDSVNHAVRKLRDCLGDTADHPRFVETIPQAGLSVPGPGRTGCAARSGPGWHLGGHGSSDGSRLRRTWWMAAGVTVLGAVVIAAIAAQRRPVDARAAVAGHARRPANREPDRERRQGVPERLRPDRGDCH